MQHFWFLEWFPEYFDKSKRSAGGFVHAQPELGQANNSRQSGRIFPVHRRLLTNRPFCIGLYEYTNTYIHSFSGASSAYWHRYRIGDLSQNRPTVLSKTLSSGYHWRRNTGYYIWLGNLVIGLGKLGEPATT